MISLLRKRCAARDDAPIGYEESKRLARDPDPAVRRHLARRSDVRPEVLYFLAEDEAAEVRCEIAANAATPRQADLLLARDDDTGVRHAVARKIAAIAPLLSREQQGQLRRLTEQVIETLAHDQAVRVRQVVAEALKDLTDAPPEVIRSLARDAELAVAGPILERSPVLLDDDLLEIIAEGPIQGALAAIARRANLAMDVTDALVSAAVDAPAEVSAISALLANDSAQIREETLDRILERAPAVPAWHAPMVGRRTLPQRVLRQLAGFVAGSLLEMLQRRPDLDPDTARAIAAEVERRLTEDKPDPASGVADRADAVPVGEEAIAAAIARGHHRGVIEALARDAGLAVAQVEKILRSQSPKGVTALAWKAGLPARLALQLQLRIAGISPRNALNPRDGLDYPLSEQEMLWQIRFFASM